MGPFPKLSIPRKGRKPRVLLSDSDRHRRYALSELLRADGFEVHSIAGHEGWFSVFASCISDTGAWVCFVAALEPDAVLVELDQLDALTNIASLRSHPLTSHVPIAVVCSLSRPSSADAARSLGADCVLSRPLPLDGLRAPLEALITRTSARTPQSCRETAIPCN